MAKYDVRVTLEQMREFAVAVLQGAEAGRGRYDAERPMQVWIEHHLILLGEATNRIRRTLELTAPNVPWEAVVGLRNVIVHGYDQLKRDRVWSSVVDDVPVLLRTVESLLADGGGRAGDDPA